MKRRNPTRQYPDYSPGDADVPKSVDPKTPGAPNLKPSPKKPKPKPKGAY